MPRYCGQCGYDTTTVPVRPGGRLCPECGAVTRGVRARGSLVRAALWTSAPFVASLPFVFLFACLGMTAPSEIGVFPVLIALGVLVWGAWGGVAAILVTPKRAVRRWPMSGARGRVAIIVAGAIVIDGLALLAVWAAIVLVAAVSRGRAF